jgi:hypothetical protein
MSPVLFLIIACLTVISDKVDSGHRGGAEQVEGPVEWDLKGIHHIEQSWAVNRAMPSRQRGFFVPAQQ